MLQFPIFDIEQLFFGQRAPSSQLFRDLNATGIFNAEVYAGMVIVIALTTLLAPFALRWFYARYSDQMEMSPNGYSTTKPIAR